MIIETFPDRASLVEREKQVVNEQMLADLMCMNLAPGGAGGIILIGELLERHRVQNTGVNNPFFGKHHTDDARANIGRAQNGNQHGKGHFPSDEVRARKSESMRLAWERDGYKKRLNESKRGIRSKLSVDQVNKAKLMLMNGVRTADIAVMFDVGIAVIRRVKKGTYSVRREDRSR